MRRSWDDQHANLPAVLVAYRIPPHPDEDTPALALLSNILGSGESSRLNRALVREAKTALAAGTQFASRRGPGIFATVVIANQGFGPDTLERQLGAEVARVRETGVTEDEITKARNDFRAGNIFGMQTTMDIAERIQHYAHLHPTLEAMHTDLDRYLAVTAGDVQRVAKQYLVPENSLVIVVQPKAGQ